MSWTDANGAKQRGVHGESKLQIVPDLPVAFAATGPGYASEVIDAYITQKFDPTKRRTEVANEIWAELCAHHKEQYGAAVNCESIGSMHDYDLETLAQASMSMLFADARGIAGVFLAEYPGPEPRCVSLAHLGSLIGHGSGIVGMGVHNFDWKVNVGRMGAAGGIELVRTMLATVDSVEAVRLQHDSDAFTITPPHDIVLLSAGPNGLGLPATWIERAEVSA